MNSNFEYDSYLNIAIPQMVWAWTVIDSNGSSNCKIQWFEVDENVDITPIYDEWTYVVPVGKKYICTNIFKSSTVDSVKIYNWTDEMTLIPNTMKLNSYEADVSMNVLHQPIILPYWYEMRANQNHFWYIVPEDFSI